MAHARASEAVRLASIVDALDEPLTIDRSVEVLTEMFFDKTVADPLYDLALFEMFMEATRNVTVREEAREWSRMIGSLVDRVLPPSHPDLPRDSVVQIVAFNGYLKTPPPPSAERTEALAALRKEFGLGEGQGTLRQLSAERRGEYQTRMEELAYQRWAGE